MKALHDALPSTFTTKTARTLGVHPRDLYRWRDDGQLLELTHGVFHRADAPLPSYPDILAVAYRAPRAIVCCVSAAAIHELTDQLPHAVQIAVPKRGHVPVIDHPPVQVLRFEDRTFELGKSTVRVAPDDVARIYDPARTVVDLMRLRHRFGEGLAHIALSRYLDTPGARPAVLLEYARALNVFGPVRMALDVLSAR